MKFIIAIVVLFFAYLIADGVCQRGPSDRELQTYVMAKTPGATSVRILRNDNDDASIAWVRIDLAERPTEEVGFEFVKLWTWPWASYFDRKDAQVLK